MASPQDAFFQHLAAACAESRRGFDRHVGMSQARRRLLVLLLEQGELSHARLHQQLEMDAATVTRLVKRLESEGLVARRLDPGDNRFTLASLTAAGEERVAELRAAHGEFQERLLAGIGRGDRKTVVRVLEQLRANLRALEADVQGRTEKGHADDDRAAQSARSEGV